MYEHADRLRRLADTARASHAVAEDDREARDAEIEAANLDGASTRDVARWTGLAPSTVQGIVVARTAARQARLTHALIR